MRITELSSMTQLESEMEAGTNRPVMQKPVPVERLVPNQSIAAIYSSSKDENVLLAAVVRNDTPASVIQTK
jgi:hypothetical protein